MLSLFNSLYKLIGYLLVAMSIALPLSGFAQDIDVNSILNAVNNAAAKDRAVNRERENRFKSEQSRQQARLGNMKKERVKQEKISVQLENQFNENEVELAKLQEQLKRELGDLKELFGVIQQTASEAQEEYKTSIISAQYPDRTDELQQMVAKMTGLTQLVSIDEIEQLWFQLQNEMTEQGRVLRFEAPVIVKTIDEEGNASLVKEQRTITRVGAFNAITGNDIARYEHGTGFVLLERQMNAAYLQASNALQSADSGVTSFALDPTKGALLSALVRKPSLVEKVQEGKIIGYAILALGALAVLIALARITSLSLVKSAVNKQSQSEQASASNPLGRLMAAFHENPDLPVESMELVAMEAIQKETPSLNRGVMLIKIIAVVAPLLGLLGTVTGMIQTFQAITLFGAGDPQMMAGGISQALVTTVLGLVVAIPAVFLHWLASSRAQSVEDSLEEYAAGQLALRNNH